MESTPCLCESELAGADLGREGWGGQGPKGPRVEEKRWIWGCKHRGPREPGSVNTGKYDWIINAFSARLSTPKISKRLRFPAD